MERRQRVDDRHLGLRGQLGDGLDGSRSGSRSHRGSARGRGRCRRSTRRGRAAVHRRAGRSASRRARRRRPRRRSGSWSRAARRRAPTLRPASIPRPAPLAAPAFSSSARSSSLPSSNAPSSSPVRKSCFRLAEAHWRILRSVQFTAIAWNLFHGRDFPPDPELLSWRSRLLRISERGNATHVQVNRSLLREFARAARAGSAGTSPCCRSARRASPPPLARACGAEATGSSPRATASAAAARRCRGATQSRPDRLRRGRLEPDPGAPRRRAGRDRRAARAGDPRRQARAPRDGLHPHRLGRLPRQPARLDPRPRAGERGRPARRARGERLGRGRTAALRRRPQPAPAPSPEAFAALEERFGLRRRAGPEAIDHLLARGLEVVSPPRRLAARATRAARARASRSASPTTPRSRRFSRRPRAVVR